MIVAGIDPGKGGAMVTLFDDGSTIVDRVPLMAKGPTKKTQPMWSQWAREWRMSILMNGIEMFLMEEVASRPGQGVTSMFNFGKTFGFAHAVIQYVDVPVHFVTPSVWKRKLGLIGADKNASREAAQRLMPSLASEVRRVKDDGVAEAGLLAYYGRKFV